MSIENNIQQINSAVKNRGLISCDDQGNLKAVSKMDYAGRCIRKFFGSKTAFDDCDKDKVVEKIIQICNTQLTNKLSFKELETLKQSLTTLSNRFSYKKKIEEKLNKLKQLKKKKEITKDYYEQIKIYYNSILKSNEIMLKNLGDSAKIIEEIINQKPKTKSKMENTAKAAYLNLMKLGGIKKIDVRTSDEDYSVVIKEGDPVRLNVCLLKPSSKNEPYQIVGFQPNSEYKLYLQGREPKLIKLKHTEISLSDSINSETKFVDDNPIYNLMIPIKWNQKENTFEADNDEDTDYKNKIPEDQNMIEVFVKALNKEADKK